MSFDPEHARLAISEAEARTSARQVRQMRLLIFALISLTILAGFSGAGFYVTYQQSRRNGEISQRVLTLTQNVSNVQSELVTTTAIAQIGTNLILDCTTPEGKCAQQGQTQTKVAIAALNQANAAGRQDVLKKVGEMARALGVPQSTIDRILNEP